VCLSKISASTEMAPYTRCFLSSQMNHSSRLFMKENLTGSLCWVMTKDLEQGCSENLGPTTSSWRDAGLFKNPGPRPGSWLRQGPHSWKNPARGPYPTHRTYLWTETLPLQWKEPESQNSTCVIMSIACSVINPEGSVDVEVRILGQSKQSNQSWI
jgi:hypothetical protein